MVGVECGSRRGWALVAAAGLCVVMMACPLSLPPGGAAPTATPTVALADVVEHIGAGGEHTLAVKSDGTVWAWGLNGDGQLGNGDETLGVAWAPVQVVGLADAVAVDCGSAHSVALKSDGTVWAWGFNFDGRLGDGSEGMRIYSPVQSAISGVTAIAAGGGHTAAIKADGSLWGWGLNTAGEVGDGTIEGVTTPTRIPEVSDVVAVAAGGGHTVALRSDGAVWAWGTNYYGGLGTTSVPTGPGLPSTAGDNYASYVPVQSAISGVAAIAAGGGHTVAVLTGGTVWSWGQNTTGQLGNGSTEHSVTPVQASGEDQAILLDVVAVAAGLDFTLALKSDGTVWAWGDNSIGQVGNSSGFPSFTPVQVDGLSDVVAIVAGVIHAVALKSDGSVWSWGANTLGQLGAPTPGGDRSSVPVRVTF